MKDKTGLPRFSRPLAISLTVLILATFAFGIFRSFAAASGPNPQATSGLLDATPTPEPTPQADEPAPYVQPVSADTTGIIALSILLVAIIILGMLRGKFLMEPRPGQPGAGPKTEKTKPKKSS